MREPASGDIEVRPVTPDQHDQVMHFFDLVAYADNPNWSRCYCQERLDPDYEQSTKEQNRAARSEQIRSGTANGLVAYRLGRVVGWCHAAPKAGLLGLAGGDAAAGFRDAGSSGSRTGAIVCFVVAPDQRRQGIARSLLDAAIPYLRDKGMTEVEAYPRSGKLDQKGYVYVNYMGPLSMYLRAGFSVVKDHGDWTLVRQSLTA